MSEYCCIKMEGILEEPESPIKYESYTRSYLLEYRLCRKLRKNEVIVVETLYYCPWCGKKLPNDLYDKWYEEIEKRFGVTDTLDKDQLKKVSPEFMSDEWWKKRVL